MYFFSLEKEMSNSSSDEVNVQRLVFEEFVDMYPNMAQELYDHLATKVWFLDKHFEDGDVSFADENGTIRIIVIEESDKKSLGRERELKALNKFFEENFRLNPVQFRPPSLFVGLTKIYGEGDSKEDCGLDWEIKNIIGKGKQGITYLACCHSDCTHVMKIEEISMRRELAREDFKNEAELSIEFSDKGIGPKVIAEYIGKDVGIIIMEKLTMTLYELLQMWKDRGPNYFGGEALRILKKKYLDVVKKLHNLGYVHGDLHLNNVMIRIHKDSLVGELRSGQYKLKLIDFGMVRSTDDEEIVEEEEDFDRLFTRHLPFNLD
jgi:serine/threonine protein kinase